MDAALASDHREPDHITDPASPRPSTGFYAASARVFYATRDGRVFLLSGPGGPCLLPVQHLPENASPCADADVAEIQLLAQTAEQLGVPASARLTALRGEAARDARVVTAALLQQLLADVNQELGRLLLDERAPDPDALHDRLVALVETSRERRCRLSSDRINRRGWSRSLPPTTGIPPDALPYAHRGAYLGWFIDFASAGAGLAEPGAAPGEPASRIRDAHLCGTLWTIARGGLVHVFRCPSDTRRSPGEGQGGSTDEK